MGHKIKFNVVPTKGSMTYMPFCQGNLIVEVSHSLIGSNPALKLMSATVRLRRIKLFAGISIRSVLKKIPGQEARYSFARRLGSRPLALATTQKKAVRTATARG